VIDAVVGATAIRDHERLRTSIPDGQYFTAQRDPLQTTEGLIETLALEADGLAFVDLLALPVGRYNTAACGGQSSSLSVYRRVQIRVAEISEWFADFENHMAPVNSEFKDTCSVCGFVHVLASTCQVELWPRFLLMAFEGSTDAELGRPWNVPTHLRVTARNGEGTLTYEMASYVRRTGARASGPGHCMALVWIGSGWRVFNDANVSEESLPGGLPATVHDRVRLAYFRRL
jgi:hypothetical protein